jgi:hypothetical protein
LNIQAELDLAVRETSQKLLFLYAFYRFQGAFSNVSDTQLHERFADI